jgi:DNA-binding IclR family transcriptional regulator
LPKSSNGSAPVSGTSSAPPEERDRYIVEAADAALSVLNLVSEAPGLKLNEIARRAGLNKSRTLRLLVTLEHHRLVERDGDGHFRLGLQSLILGSRAEDQIDIVRLVQPHLDALRDRTGETCQFRIRAGISSICVAKSDSPHAIRAHTVIGRPRELYVGSGKVMLAFGEPGLLERVIAEGLKSFTGRTFADPERLRAELAAIRAQGYSVSRGERLEGALAIGAPVRNHTGEVMGCVSLLGPEARIDPVIEDRIGEVVSVAVQLTKLLAGHRPPPHESLRAGS